MDSAVKSNYNKLSLIFLIEVVCPVTLCVRVLAALPSLVIKSWISCKVSRASYKPSPVGLPSASASPKNNSILSNLSSKAASASSRACLLLATVWDKAAMSALFWATPAVFFVIAPFSASVRAAIEF
jgi:hypothetical protein